MRELRINLRGIIPPDARPVAEDSPTRRAILALGRQFIEGMARARLAAAEGWARRLPRIHYADHLTGEDHPA